MPLYLPSQCTDTTQAVPEDGSCMLFSGDLLHGVLPDPYHHARRAKWAGEPSSVANPTHRLTLMIGWWQAPPPERSGGPRYGPRCAIPTTTRSCSWPSDLSMGRSFSAFAPNPQLQAHSPPVPSLEQPRHVRPIWEPLVVNDRAETNVEEGSAVVREPTRKRLRASSDGDCGEDAGGEGEAARTALAGSTLECEPSIDQHFFVGSIGDFTPVLEEEEEEEEEFGNGGDSYGYADDDGSDDDGE